MHLLQPSRRALLTAALLGLGACHDVSPTLPTPVVPSLEAVPSARCRVDVAERTMLCTTLDRGTSPAEGVLGDRIVGGQDVYVRLTSTGTAYDGGAQTLSTDVTLQNLAQFSMGTTDGVTPVPVKVFFDQDPTVTSGTGTVTLANADGVGTFTRTNQTYFQYAQIIAPYQISGARHWVFNVPTTVNTFVFTVYVSAPMTDETGTLLDRVWTGAVSSDWFAGGNWRNGVAPDASSTVAIPPDSLISGAHSQPVLNADAAVKHVRVGFADSLDLGTHILTASGNVDAVGLIKNGTVALTGANALVGGRLNAVSISGAAVIQRPMFTTAAVTVTGTLTSSTQPLTIQIP